MSGAARQAMANLSAGTLPRHASTAKEFYTEARKWGKQTSVEKRASRFFPCGASSTCHCSQICRCLPFIHRLHKLEEMVTLRELRAVVKSKFEQYKGVMDPRVCRDLLERDAAASCPKGMHPPNIRCFLRLLQVSEMLIFKGREELEVRSTRQPMPGGSAQHRAGGGRACVGVSRIACLTLLPTAHCPALTLMWP